MAFTNSARDQFTAIVPDNPASPTVPAHLQSIVDAIESQVVLRAADWSDADTNIAPYEDGMILFVASEGELLFRISSSWKKLSPTSYTGNESPDPSLGSDGDLYFQTS